MTSIRQYPERYLAALVFISILYYNLTPFISVDCWWHMKFAEYFLEHGKPAIYDPFAVQDGKILAIYPNVLPGLLFIWIYKSWSFLGLNVLRITLFTLFIGTVLLVVKRRWSDYSLLVQILIMAFAMSGTVILQPDLFNYLLFTIWIYLLEKISDEKNNPNRYFASLMIIEWIWANTHAMFAFYGLGFGIIYFIFIALAKWKNPSNTRWPFKKLLSFLLIMSSFWLLNPLGWRAIQAFFLHSAPLPAYATPYINQSFIESLQFADTYCYFLILGQFIIRRPWLSWDSSLTRFRLTFILFVLSIPAAMYARCLPFLFIFLIIIQSKDIGSPLPTAPVFAPLFITLTLLICTFLFVERSFLLSPMFTGKLGLKQHYSKAKGIAIDQIDFQEPIREVQIINKLAKPGNCITNDLAISSCAVWHCPDKPFFMYGNGPVMAARVHRTQTMLLNLATKEAGQFMDKHNICTVILTGSNDMILSSYAALSKNMNLIYMDPYMSILVRQGSVTSEQNQKIAGFYAGFRPGILDYQRFGSNDRALQYFFLWLSAEITQNNGTRYLAEARNHVSQEILDSWKSQVAQIIESNTLPNLQ